MNTPSIVKYQGAYYVAQFVEAYGSVVCLDVSFTQVTLPIEEVTHIKNLPWKVQKGQKFALLPSGKILNVTTGKLVEAKDAPSFGGGTHNPARYTTAADAERYVQRADRTFKVSDAKARPTVTSHLDAPLPEEYLTPAPTPAKAEAKARAEKRAAEEQAKAEAEKAKAIAALKAEKARKSRAKKKP